MPDASTLVTPSDYIRVTRDSSHADGAEDALNDALGLIQDYLGRNLVHGTYTETLRIYRNNMVYPSASPIQSVSSPNVAGISIQGAGIYVGYFNPSPVLDFGEFNAAIPPQATVTYTGGFTAQTLPTKLKRALCRVAFNILNPSTLAGLPSGVTSVHVGDVGYSGAGELATFDPFAGGVKRDLNGFRHPQVRGWQT